MAAERLQKLMAAAGVASRRACEELITVGRVQVNGHTVTELGIKADPARDRIAVDGKPLRFATDHVYFKVHKPRGVLSDIGGDAGERRTVADLLPPGTERVFTVGRLDLHSEGLVLLTDDGELANRLTHPRYHHPKTYFVLVEAEPSAQALATLRAGVELEEGRTAPAEWQVVEKLPEPLRLSKGPSEGIWLRVVLREGKKRQIRYMTAAVGYPTLRLVRWAIASLTLGDLELGQYAPLTPGEISALRRWAGLPAAENEQVRKRRDRAAAGADKGRRGARKAPSGNVGSARPGAGKARAGRKDRDKRGHG